MRKKLGPSARRRKQIPNDPMPELKVVSIGRRRKVPDTLVANSKAKPAQRSSPFVLPSFVGASLPPGTKGGKHPLAMDKSIIEVNAWATQNLYTGAFANGVGFLGYPYLAELSQIPEYRKITETIAMHMTRKFIKLSSIGETEGDESKAEKIRRINDALDKFKIRDVFRKAAEIDGYFGRAHLYIDLGYPVDISELKMPIGNGRDALSRMKVEKGSLKGFKIIEPMWTYPASYNSNNPLTGEWYNPQTWFVMQKEIHESRLLRMVGHEVTDLLKPSYSFGGISMTQMAKPYVDNWLRTRQSVADVTWAFSTSGMKTNLSTLMQDQGEDMFARAELYNNLRNNRGLMMIDKDTEEFFQINTPLGTLDKLQAQAQEHMASISSIPLVFLLGITPSGLNASSEGEIRAFYDFIHAYQMKFFGDPLTRVIDFIQLNLFGEIDQDITFEFEPLWSMNEKEQAEVDKTKAETDDLRINGGVVSPLEARKAVAKDPTAPYDGLDITVLPVPPGGGDDNEDGQPDIDPETGEPINPNPEIGGRGLNPGEPKGDGLGQDEGQWEESKHPRDHGKFAKSAGGSGAGGPGPEGHEDQDEYGNPKPVKPKSMLQHHLDKQVKGILDKAPGISGKYRQSIAALLKEPTIDVGTKTKLKEKLAGSYVAKAAQLQKKGEVFKAMQVAKKADKIFNALKKELGAQYASEPAQKNPADLTAGSPPVLTEKELFGPPPKHTVDKSHNQPDKFIVKSPDGKVYNQNGEAGGGGPSMKFSTQAEAESYAKKMDEKKPEPAKTEPTYEEKQKAKLDDIKEKLSGLSAIGWEDMSEEDKDSLADLALFSGAGDARSHFLQAKGSKPVKDGVISAAKAAHIFAYTGSGYLETNAQLRNNQLTEETYNHVKQLDAALAKLPKHEDITRRGTSVPKEEFDKWVPGKIIGDPGFMSTTKKGESSFGNTKLEIHGKNGRDISKLSHHPGEQEVLFPSGSRFRVVSKSGNKVVLHEV